MSTEKAATLIAMMGGSSIIGRLAIGFFIDKIGGKNGYILCLTPIIAALVAFSLFENHWLLFVIMALYGFAHGGLFTVVSPTIAEYFGTKEHGAIFGLVVLCGTIGSTFGPIVAGWTFDVAGSFTPAFVALAILAALGLLLILTLQPLRPDEARP